MNHNKLHDNGLRKKVEAGIAVVAAAFSLTGCEHNIGDNVTGVHCAGGDKMVAVRGDTREAMFKRNAEESELGSVTTHEMHLAVLKQAEIDQDAKINKEPAPEAYDYIAQPGNVESPSHFTVGDIGVEAGKTYIIPKCALSTVPKTQE